MMKFCRLLAAVLFVSACAALLLFTVAGCVTVTPAPPPTTQQALDGIDADVYDAVRSYLHFEPGRTDAVEDFALRVKRIASESVDATVLRQEIVHLLLERSHLSNPDRESLEFVTDLIISRVKRRLGLQIDVTLVPADKLVATRRLLITAADAALRAVEDVRR